MIGCPSSCEGSNISLPLSGSKLGFILRLPILGTLHGLSCRRAWLEGNCDQICLDCLQHAMNYGLVRDLGRLTEYDHGDVLVALRFGVEAFRFHYPCSFSTRSPLSAIACFSLPSP